MRIRAYEFTTITLKKDKQTIQTIMNKTKRFSVIAIVLLMAVSMMAGDVFSLRRAAKAYLEDLGYSVEVAANDDEDMTVEKDGSFYFLNILDSRLGFFMYITSGFYVGNQDEPELMRAINYANASAALSRYFVNRDDGVVACSAGHFLSSEEDIPQLWLSVLGDFANGEDIIFGDLSTEVDTVVIEEEEEVSSYSPVVGTTEVTDTEEPDNSRVFDVAEQMPSFPGGQAALMQWLSSNVNYPATAAANGIQGRVIVRFVVEKTGSVSGATIMKSVDPLLDKEAVRVVSSMPKWIPGMHNGKAVRVFYTVPVTFRL